MTTAKRQDFRTPSGLRKSAILLLALDEDTSANVFRYMSSREIQQITQEMAVLGHVTQNEVKQVLKDFNQDSEQVALMMSSNDYIRSVLTKALGSDRAASILDDLLEHQEAQSSGIDALNLVEPGTAAEMIRDEHPQVIATILVHLERNQAADILELFDEKLRNDVVLRIATFSGVQPAALQELTDVLGTMLEGQNLRRSKMGGVKTAAEILNLLNSSLEETVIETVRAYSEDLAQRIIDEMFLFENLIEVDDRAIQLILKEVDPNSLAVALKGVPDALVDKFTSNMSHRAAELLVEDMESRGPIRISQVEAEQKIILQIVRRLADNGEIILSGGDDGYV